MASSKEENGSDGEYSIPTVEEARSTKARLATQFYPIEIRGAIGSFGSTINSTYIPSPELFNGLPIYVSLNNDQVKLMYDLISFKWKVRLVDGDKPKTIAKFRCRPPDRPENIGSDVSWQLRSGYGTERYITCDRVDIRSAGNW